MSVRQGARAVLFLGRKRAALSFTAELASWLAMFLMAFAFFMLLSLKSCSPALHGSQQASVGVLTGGQDALFVLRMPAVYQGQDVTLASLVSRMYLDDGRQDRVALISKTLAEGQQGATGVFTVMAGSPERMRKEYDALTVDGLMDDGSQSLVKLASPDGRPVWVIVNRMPKGTDITYEEFP